MITIRKINEADYEALFLLYQNELNIQLSFSDFVSRINIVSNDAKHDTFVALFDDAVVGFISLEKSFVIECDYVKINGIAVKEEFQRRGIGSLLLTHAENYARQNEINLILLNSSVTREHAHMFYERSGFCKTSYSFRKQLKV